MIHDDHGDFGGCAGPLRCGKGTTWEGGQRVPGLISYPGHIEPGTSHALTTILDIMPTIMSIVGGDMPDDGVSYDLSDLLFDGREVKREVYLFCTIITVDTSIFYGSWPWNFDWGKECRMIFTQHELRTITIFIAYHHT